jgi:Alpha/beta hydrolase domain
VRHLILSGHSQTGAVITEYILNGHAALRQADGSPVYDGFFPSGAPSVQFDHVDVPVLQVLSDGDITDPNRPGREGRRYRRDDSDDPADRYRLYELAGVGHMGTRYPPYSDASMWQNDPLGTAGSIPPGATMNSLPHDELFSMGLHHLAQWVAAGSAPPRADRIEVGPDGFLAQDEYGNSRGGVRCAQMDVPRLRYFSNPGVKEDGTPAFGVVGIEEPLPRQTLQELYADHHDYVERFNRRLDELIAQGWFLDEDADGMRAEAEKAEVP